MITCYVSLTCNFETLDQVILGEEVSSSKLTLYDITKWICDAVQARADKGSSLKYN